MEIRKAMPTKNQKKQEKLNEKRAAAMTKAREQIAVSGWTLTEREYRGEVRPVASPAAKVIIEELKNLGETYPEIRLIIDAYTHAEPGANPFHLQLYTPCRVRGKGFFHPTGSSPKKREKREAKGRAKGRFDIYHGPVCDLNGKEVSMKSYRRDVKDSEALKNVHGFTPVEKPSDLGWVPVPNTGHGFLIEGWRVMSRKEFFLDLYYDKDGKGHIVVSRKIIRLKKSTGAYG